MAFSVNYTICCYNIIPYSPNPTSTSSSTATTTTISSSSSSSFLFPSPGRRRRRLPLPVLKNKVVNHQISCSSTQLSQSRKKEEEEESSWRRRKRSTQCVVLGMMACMIIDSTHLPLAFAADSSFTTTTTAAHHHQQAAEKNIPKQKKWSDKQRVCQPWRLNSLETIVPENLPRPSAHRRSESISTSTTTAPPLVNSKVVLLQTNANNCFSM